MAATSAGLLLYRQTGDQTEFLLGHPGGPIWARRDFGAWMIPKGLIEDDEAPLAAARREFLEETGLSPPEMAVALPPLRQAGGKLVLCFAAESDIDLAAFRPGLFEMQWPPRSGRRQSFPELDRVQYFVEPEALQRVLPSQAPLIQEVCRRLPQRTE